MMILRSGAQAHERGAALLSALLLIAVLSGVVVAVLDDIRFAVRRTANIRLYDQALWYARGAEDLGRQMIWRSWRAQPARSTLNDPWAQQGVQFPIEGGVIEGRITDGGNCFNLNSVVVRDDHGRWVADDQGRQQFERLLRAIGLNGSDAEGLSAIVADWIDTDSASLPGGAEDSDYMRLNPPYRTGGALLGDATELRAMRGVTDKLYRAMRPYVCALPDETPSLINVNTLSLEQAPLVVMLAADGLSLATARRAIEARPLSGFGTADEFWDQTLLAPYRPGADMPQQTTVMTRYFMLETHVIYDTADVTTTTLVELGQDGRSYLHMRRIGVLE